MLKEERLMIVVKQLLSLEDINWLPEFYLFIINTLRNIQFISFSLSFGSRYLVYLIRPVRIG